MVTSIHAGRVESDCVVVETTSSVVGHSLAPYHRPSGFTNSANPPIPPTRH